jgi:hypothetical protein
MPRWAGRFSPAAASVKATEPLPRAARFPHLGEWNTELQLREKISDHIGMTPTDPFVLTLVAIAALLMTSIMLRGITGHASGIAAALAEAAHDADDSATRAKKDAEKMGRAAALEPLAQNPDGSIIEPIVGVVERR